MISSLWLFGKWCIRPAVAELFPNRALMIRSKPFLFRFISPHDPALQRLIKLARPDHPLTNPVQKRSPWDAKVVSQFGQVWYYHQDKLLEIWECFLDSRFRMHPLVADPHMRKLWQGVET